MGKAKKARLADAMATIVQGTITATMPNATAVVPSVDGVQSEQPITPVVAPVQQSTGVEKYLSAKHVCDSAGNPVRIHCKQNFVAAVYMEVCDRLQQPYRPLCNAALHATKQIIAYVPEMPHKNALRTDADPRNSSVLKNELSASGMNGYLRVLSHTSKAARIFEGSALSKPHTGVNAHRPQAKAYCDAYALHIPTVQTAKPKE